MASNEVDVHKDKKKKAKKRKAAREEHDGIIKEKKSKPDSALNFEWNDEEDTLLVSLIKENCDSKAHRTKFIFLKHIDWKVIAGRFASEKGVDVNGEIVKKRWEELAKRVRKLRTIQEMIEDVKRNIKLHLEELPKKPAGAFQLYAKSKRARLTKKYPDMSAIDMSKRLGKKWRETPPEKKQKYEKRAKEEKDKYNVALEEWKAQNPEGWEEINQKNKKVLKVNKAQPVSAFSLFAEKKRDHLKSKYPGLDEERIQAKLRKKWGKLNEDKKAVYVEEAKKVVPKRINAKQKNSEVRHLSGYQLFYQTKSKELLEDNPKVNFGEISTICAKLWKEMDVDEKAKIISEAKSQALPPKRKSKPNAYRLFFSDARQRYLEENPNLSFGDIAKLCAKEWKTLDADQVNSYKEKAKGLTTE